VSAREREVAANHKLKAGRNAEREDGADFMCECADLRCNATITLTPGEHAERRVRASRFWVKPGHALLTLEHVVEENDRYIVLVSQRTE
jgi:hypothetical protein